MSESAMERVRGAIGGITVGIVLVFAGATSANSEVATIAIVAFFGACGFVFSPWVQRDELADL